MTETSNERYCLLPMKLQFPYSVTIRFPGDLEYIPAVRKFIAELLQVSSFSSKFAYRSEIIVDEICNNAVSYGCQHEAAEIELVNELHDDRIEFTIKDQGGSQNHIGRLQSSISSSVAPTENETQQEGLGLEIVRMLSESLNVIIDEQNLTSVHIVRKRESEREEIRPSN